jgi:hypothetical protein
MFGSSHTLGPKSSSEGRPLVHNTAAPKGSHLEEMPWLCQRKGDSSPWQYLPLKSLCHIATPGAVFMGISYPSTVQPRPCTRDIHLFRPLTKYFKVNHFQHHEKPLFLFCRNWTAGISPLQMSHSLWWLYGETEVLSKIPCSFRWLCQSNKHECNNLRHYLLNTPHILLFKHWSQDCTKLLLGMIKTYFLWFKIWLKKLRIKTKTVVWWPSYNSFLELPNK